MYTVDKGTFLEWYIETTSDSEKIEWVIDILRELAVDDTYKLTAREVLDWHVEIPAHLVNEEVEEDFISPSKVKLIN